MLNNEGIAVRQVPSCPLCGRPGIPLYEELRDRYFDAPGLWSFRQCGGCSHIWLDPAPLPSELKKLYLSYWDRYNAVFHPEDVKLGHRAADALYELANRAVLYALGYEGTVQAMRDRLLGKGLALIPILSEIFEGAVMSLRGPSRGHLLDIGCGTGSFLVFMRSLGWDVAGLESDPKAVQVAREGHGLKVTEADIEDADLPEATYDAITMGHVIEHVLNPVQVLRVVFRWLKPGGTLVIRTPNARSWGHRLFHESWMSLDPPRHLHLFSPRTLQTCVERAGFLIKDIHTSARSAQGVFHVSRTIALGGPREPGGAYPGRSLRSRAFILAEMVMCLVNQDAGEEIVLLARRPIPEEQSTHTTNS